MKADLNQDASEVVNYPLVAGGSSLVTRSDPSAGEETLMTSPQPQMEEYFRHKQSTVDGLYQQIRVELWT